MYFSGSQHKDQLMDDTGCRIEELPITMEDREGGGIVSWNTEQARPYDDDDDYEKRSRMSENRRWSFPEKVIRAG